MSVTQWPLVWLNVVCLDAPLVAVAWQWLFASSFHIAVSASARDALFLTGWLIYLIDRLADSLSLRADSAKSLRQQFCLRHAKLWMGLIPVIAMLDAIIVFSHLDSDLLLSGACVGGIAFVYLMLNYAFSQLWETIPLKEITVGSLFAAGTLLALSTFSGTTFIGGRSAIPSAAFLFAMLCSLNCMSIAVWERELDRSQGKHSIATRWLGVGFWVRTSCVVLAFGSLIIAVIDHALWPLALCLSISAILLATLHLISIQRDERVALADLVLLTPVAFLCA